MAYIFPNSPKNAVNSPAIYIIFMKNLKNYAHFSSVMLSCKGLIKFIIGVFLISEPVFYLLTILVFLQVENISNWLSWTSVSMDNIPNIELNKLSCESALSDLPAKHSLFMPCVFS